MPAIATKQSLTQGTPSVSESNAQFVALQKAAGDSLRANVLQILHRDSFGVLELCEILEVPQPALSHHLKILYQAGLVIKRKEGTSVFYRRVLPHTADESRILFSKLIEQIYKTLDALPLSSFITERITEVHRKRARRSQDFFENQIKNSAEQFASQQALICEQSVYAESVRQIFANNPQTGNKALEVGPGEGEILKILSDHFEQVIGFDSSEVMLQHTQNALADQINSKNGANILLSLAEFGAQGEPADSEQFDAIVLSMVLHHAASPISLFQQAEKQLSEEGMLLVVELLPHDQDWVKEACGDLWLGFEPEALEEWAQQTSFVLGSEQYLAQRNGFRIQIKTFFKNFSQELPTGAIT